MKLNQVKTYAIGVLFLFCFLLALNIRHLGNKLQFANSEKERYFNNWISAQSESDKNSHQIYRIAEFNEKLRHQVDSLAKILRVRPKTITKIEYRFTTFKIPGIQPLPVKPINKTTFDFVDSTKCFVYKGQVILTDKTPTVNRTDFAYHNKTTSVYARERAKKFLFIRYGKYVNTQRDSSECGEIVVKTFEFVK
jgi:hypothetical protein